MRSTVWTAQTRPWSYIEKRRGRKETEVARRVKGGIKRRETDPASNQFPKCSPLSGTQRFTELGREEKRSEEIEVTWWRKKRVQTGSEQSSQ